MSLEPPLRHSWIASDRAVPRLIARPLREFLSTEAAGGIVLLVATVVALVWANSPLAGSYESLWGTEIGISIGDFTLSADLHDWVNDGLMVIFFFVVGLEIKRELIVGELSDPRRAALPVIAALGGMVAPALLYLVFNAGGPGGPGWGIPMATDIAFAVGVLSLVGRRAPPSLRVFLLSLAIADDIGAILVIAVFYASDLSIPWLATALVLLGVMGLMRRLRVWWLPAYVIVGTCVWFATFQSGVHATIAGVTLGFLAPARPIDPEGAIDAINEATALEEEPSPARIRAIMLQAKEVVSVGERLAHLLHPWSSFVVIPIFALANAGVTFSAAALSTAVTSPVALGVLAGLVAGKIVGITGFSWVAVRLGIGELSEELNWRLMLGLSAVAGIGFTVSIFVAGLAFDDAVLVEEAKLGIFAASLFAALLGAVLLKLAQGRDEIATTESY